MEGRSSLFVFSPAPKKLKTEYLSKPAKVLSESAVAVGSFDGLHIGHRKVIDCLVASCGSIPSVVFTFSPHPRAFFEGNFPVLTTDAEKTAVLTAMGVNTAVFAQFDEAFAKQSAEVFVKEYLISSLGMTKLVIGSDHTIGRGRGGDVSTLGELARQMNFELIVVEPEMLDNAPVKSTRIREFVSKGELETAAKMLGRPYSISGTIIEGHGRGEKLGFPTVNFLPPREKLLPPTGVFTAEDADGIPGLLYIGSAPTFGNSEIIAEFHGIEKPSTMAAEFGVSVFEMIRKEEKFESVEQLVDQMHRDRDKLLVFLKKCQT